MIMRAEVKAIYTTDMDYLELYPPEDPGRFRIWVRAMVGSKVGEGEDSFDICVCTPSWIEEACEREGFVVGRHFLVVGRFDVAFIKKVIIELIEGCEGNTWQEVAEKVSRIGHWEFEDYKPKRP
jgi:hypothetical protein